jgi:hypothetical protein
VSSADFRILKNCCAVLSAASACSLDGIRAVLYPSFTREVRLQGYFAVLCCVISCFSMLTG